MKKDFTDALVLAMVVCILQLNAVHGGDENEGETNPLKCNFKLKDLKQQCYNRAWCADLFSTSYCSEESRCCKQLHRQVECLTDILAEQDSVSSLQTQTKNRFSDITNMVKISENNMTLLLKKETENLDMKLNKLDNKWKEFENKQTSSLTTLQTSLDQSRTKAKDDLEKASSKLNVSIENIETRLQSLNDTVKTNKATLDSDIERKTKDSIQQSVNTINEESKKLNIEINELSTKIDKTTAGINAWLEILSSRLTESENDVKRHIKKEIETVNMDIEHKANVLDTKLAEMSSDTKTDIEKTNTNILRLEEDVKKYKFESDESLTKTESELTELVNGRMTEIQSNLDNSIISVNKDIELLRKEIGTLIREEVEQLSSQTQAVNQTVTQQKKRVDIIYPNVFNKEMFTVAFLVLAVLMALNFIIVYILVKRTSLSSGHTTDNTQQAVQMKREPHSPVEVYKRLNFARSLPHEFSEPLNNTVGVVSFYEDSQKHHRRLMKTVRDEIPGQILDDVIEYHVVRRHEHIPGIPLSKLCIMFVEFSERHVIIEKPGLGLGDLKRKTAEHINKLGACLVIVYVKDPGSRDLRNSELFNSSIHCVKSQPELKTLSEDRRFLSIYDKFTTTQIERLVDIITEHLRHTGS